MYGIWYMVYSSWYVVYGSGYMVQGTGFMVYLGLELRLLGLALRLSLLFHDRAVVLEQCFVCLFGTMWPDASHVIPRGG